MLNMEIKKNKSKIIIMGLDNAGKTSIILSMQKDTNIMSFYKLKPTKGINRINFEDFATDFNIWDFGGQEQFRDDYILDMNKHTIGAKKLIFTIDIQDKERFDLALEYFKKIIDSIKDKEESIELSIFLHKFDPNLETDKNINDNASNIIKKIKDMNLNDFKIRFFKTSIYTIFNKVEAE